MGWHAEGSGGGGKGGEEPEIIWEREGDGGVSCGGRHAGGGGVGQSGQPACHGGEIISRNGRSHNHRTHSGGLHSSEDLPRDPTAQGRGQVMHCIIQENCL